MEKKRSSKMVNRSHQNSLKMRTEVKDFIDRMVVTGIPVTKKSVMEGTGCSNGFVNNEEITAYIKQAQERQKHSDMRVDIDLQNTVLSRKLLSSYIFQYALLDEQETFLEEAIKDMKTEKLPEKALSVLQIETIIDLLVSNIEKETNGHKIIFLLKNFQNAFSEDIPNWKKRVLDILKEKPDCLALQIIKSIQ